MDGHSDLIGSIRSRQLMDPYVELVELALVLAVCDATVACTTCPAVLKTIDQHIERKRGICLLHKAAGRILTHSNIGHIGQIIANDGIDDTAIGAAHLLDDVAKVGHNKRKA